MLGLVLVVLAGCAELPVSGPVRHEDSVRVEESLDAPYFDPPGPAADGTPSAIVSGFLTALQANPISTRVAREFLSERVRSTWQPNRGTLVYDAFSVVPASGGVQVRLSDVRRLDARGGWEGGSPGESELVDVGLVSEDGQWRIDNPPGALIVPASFFERAFERTNLYFFDQTGRVLLPDTVFVPRGEQTATNLVRGLLAGPGSALGEVSRTAFPRGTDLELSVVVTESGVAEVPLTRELLRASASELRRAAEQLGWTLGQVPGVERVRMSVSGTPVPLPGGVIDVTVDRAASLDAAGPPDADLLLVQDQRLVRLGTDGPEAVPGRLGQEGLERRSLSATADTERVAGVSLDGTRLLTSPLAVAGDRSESEPALTGTDLARPSFDLFGGLWVLDRTASGARVVLLDGDRPRELRVPGVTGRDVTALTVAHDGSRLAVGYGAAEAAGDRVAVVDVLRTEEGSVSGTGPPRYLDLPATEGADGADGGNGGVVDVAWRDPGTLAVLSRTGSDSSRVDLLATDGSPLGRTAVDSTVFRGLGSALVVSPSAGTDLGLLTEDGVLYTLGAQATWARNVSGVSAATFAS